MFSSLLTAHGPELTAFLPVRDQLLGSGVPVMIAAVCFFVLAYLARIRGERFLRFWTAGWALFVVRLAWTVVWGSPFTAWWQGETGAILRVLFAAMMFAGVEELRGRRVDARVVVGATLLFFAVKLFPELALSHRTVVAINMAPVLVLLLAAAWRLGTHEALPRAERAFAGLALAVYGVLTSTLPLFPENSPRLPPLFFASWTSQLCVGVGMLAIFFRASYEAELSAEKRRGATLTEALQDFLPICMFCKSIRDEEQHWKSLERYVADRSSVRFSHGLCPTCAATHFGEAYVEAERVG